MTTEILDCLDEGILIYNKDFQVTFLNKVASSFWSEHHLQLPIHVTDLLPYFSLEGKFLALQKGLAGKQHYTLVPFVINKTACNAEIHILPIPDKRQGIIKIKPITPDTVTQSLIGQLKKTDERLRYAQKLAKTGTWVYDPFTEVGEWSDEAYEIFGLSPIQGVPRLDQQFHLVHPADRVYLFKAFKRALKDYESYSVDFRVVLPTGEIIYVNSKGEPVCDTQKKLMYLRGTFTDITDKKRIEESFNQFFKITPDLLCLVDFNGNFVKVNPASEKILEYTEKELVGKSIVQFLHPEDIERTLEVSQKIMEGHRVVSFENRYRCKSGEYKWLQWSASAMPADKLTFAAAHDITHQRKLTDELEQHSHSLEEFIIKISEELSSSQHQIKNASVLLANGFSGKPVNEKLEEASQKVTELSRYISSTLTLVKNWNKPLEITPIDLKHLLYDVMMEFDEQLPTPIRRVIHTEGKQLFSDTVLLREVFKQLITHTINFRKSETQNVGIWINAETNKQKCLITYQDNSIGMTPDLENLFTDDYAKYYPKNNTRLGLYMVRQIIEKLDGKIQVSATPSRGVVFSIQISNLKDKHILSRNEAIFV